MEGPRPLRADEPPSLVRPLNRTWRKLLDLATIVSICAGVVLLGFLGQLLIARMNHSSRSAANQGDSDLSLAPGINLTLPDAADSDLAVLKQMSSLLAAAQNSMVNANAAYPMCKKDLRVLNLTGNKTVTDAGLAPLKEIKSLRRLDLSDTRVTDVGLANLKNVNDLQWLGLSDTQVTDDGLAQLQAMKHLQTLILEHTSVTDAGLAYLKGSDSLQWLDLSSTLVTDAGLASLKRLKVLRHLDLSDTLVTDAGLTQLKQMKGLQSLILEHTLVTGAGTLDLRAALPETQVAASTAFAESGASSAPPADEAGDRTTRDITKWFADSGWGVFCHWLGNSDLTAEEWNHRVDAFDAKGLADQLAAIGAPYFVITIGQNSGYYLAPNATYDKYVGIQPSKCSRRDLVSDLYDCLHPRGIELLVYLPSGAPSDDPVAVERLGWEDGFVAGSGTRRTGKRLAEFQRKWEDVIREWSTRWGPKVRGWWIDGCYFADEMYRHNDEPNFRSFAAALKAGNPDALVAFNTAETIPAVCPTEYADFTAGETLRPLECLGPWVVRNGHKARFHTLTFLGEAWARGKPRFSDEWVVGYTKYVMRHGGVITWDVPLELSGRISAPFVKQLTMLGRSLGKGRNDGNALIPDLPDAIDFLWHTDCLTSRIGTS